MSGRLRGRRTFARLRAEGRQVRSGLVSCTVILDRSLSGPQVGFVVGKASGPAVRRNRIRRRLRVLVKPHEETLPPGLFLFGASPRLAACPFEDAERSMKSLIPKLIPVGTERSGALDVR